MPPDDAGPPPAAPRFLLDQNVQEAVRQFLDAQGYQALRTRDLSGTGASDGLIAFIASSQGLVLLTHDSDFRRLDRLLPGAQRRLFERGAGQILLQVRETRSVTRFQAEWQSILFHYTDAQTKGIRFQLVLNETGIRVVTNAPLSRPRNP